MPQYNSIDYDDSVCRAVKKSTVELTLSCSTEANTTVQADLA